MLTNNESVSTEDAEVESEYSGSIVSENQLLTDESGDYKDSIIEKFLEYKEQLTGILSAGLPPSEYEKFNGYINAVDSAVNVIEAVWEAGRRDAEEEDQISIMVLAFCGGAEAEILGNYA